ncbi:ORF1049 [White spot syndrome virus]|uniref:ORF1049 n=1 Tax=White spot syndrome virus TaxID=342409 RepID=A0A2D3I542_9VIRU|nr:ORF1049 [White spot syndrome virus]
MFINQRKVIPIHFQKFAPVFSNLFKCIFEVQFCITPSYHHNQSRFITINICDFTSLFLDRRNCTLHSLFKRTSSISSINNVVRVFKYFKNQTDTRPVSTCVVISLYSFWGLFFLICNFHFGRRRSSSSSSSSIFRVEKIRVDISLYVITNTVE